MFTIIPKSYIPIESKKTLKIKKTTKINLIYEVKVLKIMFNY